MARKMTRRENGHLHESGRRRRRKAIGAIEGVFLSSYSRKAYSIQEAQYTSPMDPLEKKPCLTPCAQHVQPNSHLFPF